MARKNNIDVIVKGDYQDKDINRAINDLKKMQAAGMSVGGKLQKLGSDVQQFGKSVSRVGGTLTKSVTLPIVGIGAAATKMAMDFDDSLTKMVSLVGLTRDEVDGMRGDIIAMASQYGKSASEAADAMFFITSAGLRGSSAMDALEASLKGAAVGLGDVKTIADLATSAVNAYGSDTLSASKATDVLAAAVREGKLESSELAGAMGQVLPIASAMGVGFDEVGAAMAAMSRTGTNAAAASTQLRGILNSILKPTAKAEKAMQGMGLSSEDLRKQLREEGLLATLQTLNDRFDGNQAATAEVFGNVRALSGVLDLMGANADTTAEIFGNLTNTTGMLDDALGAASQTTGFQMRQAFATLKNSLIEFGDVIAPFVAQFAQRIKTLGEAFQNLSPQAKAMIVTVAGIAAAVGPVLLILGKLITMVGGVIKVIGLLVAGFNPVTLVIGAVVLAIVGLVLAIRHLWTNSEAFRDGVMRIWDMIRAAVVRVIDTIKAKIDENRETIETLRQAFQAVSDFIMAYVVPILMTFIENYLKVVITVVTAIISTVVELIATFAAFIARIVAVGAAIATFVASAVDWFAQFKDSITTAMQAIGTTVARVWNGIFTTISGILTRVKDAFRAAINFIIRGWNRLSFSVPSVTVAGQTFGGFSIGVPQIPELARGGIVMGPTLALIGEAGPEAVVPLTGRNATRAGVGGSTINLTVNAGMGTDGAELGRQIVEALKAYERRNGSVYVSA